MVIMGILPDSAKVKRKDNTSRSLDHGDIKDEDIMRVRERREIEHLKAEKSPLNKIAQCIFWVLPKILAITLPVSYSGR